MASNTDRVEEILTRYANLIKKVILETSPQIDSTDMDDIEQEIRIILWNEFSKSEKIIRHPYSYIRRVAFTTTSRMMRKVSEKREKTEVFDASEYENPTCNGNILHYGREIDESELLGILAESIDTLAGPRASVVKMHLMGMDISDISEFLNWSHAKVRNLLYRGLTDLRDRLDHIRIDRNL